MTNSEEIIYAPIEIESADQLHALGATWEDCKTWKFGHEYIKVLLVPADEEVRDYLVKELKTANVFNNNIEWAKTPDISLYVTYRSRSLSHNTYSGYFVLIQNAKIKQPRGFRC